MPRLQHKRTSPTVLPVDDAGYCAVLDEYVLGVEVPVPDGRLRKLGLGRKVVRYDVLEHLV